MVEPTDGGINQLKTFVLDTNVLLHDSDSLKAFSTNEVVIPLAVLDELDNAKTRFDEVGRNARAVVRMLDKLRGMGSLNQGVEVNGSVIRVELNHSGNVPEGLSIEKVDNRIISTALGLQKAGKKIIVVSKDINLRVKCDVLGLEAEDYEKGKIATDVDTIYGGVKTLFVPSETINALYADGHVTVEGAEAYPNQFFILKSSEKESHSGIARFKDGMFKLCNFPKELWSIVPRNAEQRMAMELLIDPSVKLVTLIGKAGSGKAQSLDSPVLTPKGYVRMGDVVVGSTVMTPSGMPAKVIGVFPQGMKSMYEVTFDDGSSTECCKEHLWYTETSLNRDQNRLGSVKSLETIANSITYGKNKKKNHSIPMIDPIDFVQEKPLAIDPYALGVLLGDGCFRGGVPALTTADEELLTLFKMAMPHIVTKRKQGSKYDYYLYDATKRTLKNALIRTNGSESKTYFSLRDITSEGFVFCSMYKAIKKNKPYRGFMWNFSTKDVVKYINSTREALTNLGLYGLKSVEKFVPNEYKINSFKNRLALLQGLMDTDGSISNEGYCVVFNSSSAKLATDVRFLVESLGGKVRITSRITKYEYKGVVKEGQVSFRVWISLPPGINPFRLSRKHDAYVPKSKYLPKRYITGVRYIGEKPAQCIYVDHPDHLYVTNNFIVTHNTLISLAAALHHVVNNRVYNRILISRPIQPMGRDLGFLPGDVEEKLAPWMQPLYDNLELLLGADYSMIDMYKEQGIIHVEPLTYIRGRSIPNSFIIIDEAQNLSAHEIKTIITRIGENSKIVLTGDVDQIDNPYVDFADNGLTHVVEKFKEYPIAGHVTLRKGERSELATLASEIL
jgi:prepilin-type processing-associated H-X9-DG protein